MKTRLSKTLSATGLASRRKCEDLIFEGHVKVNGEVVKVPQTMVDSAVDKITVYDQPFTKPEPKVYYLLNKPIGYICSNEYFRGGNKVLDLFEGCDFRLFTVGRLDKDTSGLLIVTNDGHFANDVIHPSSNIEKEYIAKTNKEITAAHLAEISKGMTLEDGSFVKPVDVAKVRRGTVKVTVSDGKKREVRQLLIAAGLEVRELKRTRIGNLRLGELPVGRWRKMTDLDRSAVFA